METIKKKLTVHPKNWNRSTPKFFRNLGDALLALGGGGAFVIGLMDQWEGSGKDILIVIFAGIGTFGKFFTKLFNDD
jgi:hypothetical protein